jgi:hypothetical protein
MPRAREVFATLLAVAALGCDGIEPPDDTGGVDVPVRDGCGRGIVVVSSDYQSTNVSLIDFEGRTLSESIVSSASVAPGLNAALSGDVAVPTQVAGEEIVLIDRYPAGVLSWVDVVTGRVRAQLNVASGFIANPHDYAAVSPTRAFVTRFDENSAPGREPHDAGSDILVVDPSQPKVVGRVDLRDAFGVDDPEFLPRPDRTLLVDDRLVVLLAGYSLDFERAALTRLTALDAEHETVLETIALDAAGCSTLALSPSRERLAVACAGTFGGDSVSSLVDSAVVVVEVGPPLRVEARFGAEDLGAQPIGWGLDWTSEERLLVVTWGQLDDDGRTEQVDRAFELDVETGRARELWATASTPFALGEVRCAPACDACFMADAETRGGVVQRFPLEPDGSLGESRAFEVERRIGLPPRYLGRF